MSLETRKKEIESELKDLDLKFENLSKQQEKIVIDLNNIRARHLFLQGCMSEIDSLLLVDSKNKQPKKESK